MPLLRLPRRAQRLFATPVEADGQRRKGNFLAVEGDAAVAGEIQADLDAAGVKTFAPVKFRVRLEVVPLETHALPRARCRANAASPRQSQSTPAAR